MALPHLEQSPVFNSANFSLPAWSGANSTACVATVGAFRCPSDYTATRGFLERDGFRYARS